MIVCFLVERMWMTRLILACEATARLAELSTDAGNVEPAVEYKLHLQTPQLTTDHILSRTKTEVKNNNLKFKGLMFLIISWLR